MFRRGLLSRTGTWDDDAYAGIVLSCVVTLGTAVAAAALWAVPSVRRITPWWWLLPALLSGAAAGARWAVGG